MLCLLSYSRCLAANLNPVKQKTSTFLRGYGRHEARCSYRSNVFHMKHNKPLRSVVAVSCLTVCGSSCFCFYVLRNRHLKDSFRETQLNWDSKKLFTTPTLMSVSSAKSWLKDSHNNDLTKDKKKYSPKDDYLERFDKIKQDHLSSLHKTQEESREEDRANDAHCLDDKSYEEDRSFGLTLSEAKNENSATHQKVLWSKESDKNDNSYGVCAAKEENEANRFCKIDRQEHSEDLNSIKHDELNSSKSKDNGLDATFPKKNSGRRDNNSHSVHGTSCVICSASGYLVEILQNLLVEIQALHEKYSHLRPGHINITDQVIRDDQQNVFMDHHDQLICERLECLQHMLNTYEGELKKQMSSLHVTLGRLEEKTQNLECELKDALERAHQLDSILLLQQDWSNRPMSISELISSLSKKFRNDDFIQNILQHVPNNLGSSSVAYDSISVESLKKEFLTIHNDALQCLFFSSRKGLVNHLIATSRRWFYEKTHYVLPDRLLWSTCADSRSSTYKNVQCLNDAISSARAGDVCEAFQKMLLLEGEFPYWFHDWLSHVESTLTAMCLFNVVVNHLRCQRKLLQQ